MTTSKLANHIPLVEATRGGFVESVHNGSFVAVAPSGEVLLEGDEPQHPVSPLKVLQ